MCAYSGRQAAENKAPLQPAALGWLLAVSQPTSLLRSKVAFLASSAQR